MPTYREVRVRPVVRYIVTFFEMDDDDQNVGQQSIQYGIFDNVDQANIVGEAVAMRENRLDKNAVSEVVFEPARRLKIDWLRGPGESKEAIRWELSEVEDNRIPNAVS